MRLDKKVLQLKGPNGKGHRGQSYRTSSKGTRNVEKEVSERIPHLIEIGRISQFARTTQAKRDSQHFEAGS